MRPLWTANKALDKITALTFTKDGRKLIVGLLHGQLVIYQIEKKKLNYCTTIDCKNRKGKFKAGRKITGLTFLSLNELLVTTCDSRLRLIDLTDYQQIFKYKGHSNTSLPMCASSDNNNTHIICGSEDGNVYIWNKVSTYVPSINPIFTLFKKDRNGSIEFFKPFQEKKMAVTCALFLPMNVMKPTMQKFGLYDIIVGSVFIACGMNGHMRIFVNRLKA